MQSNRREKKSKLSREILELFFVSTVVSIFFFGFLSITTNAIVLSYCEEKQIDFSQIEASGIELWIESISFAAAVFLFVVLFLFLLGQKMTYLTEIIRGIEALGMHNPDYKIPLEDDNEFTELARCINEFVENENALRLKEKRMQEEKEELIRALSHDIRTPLTSILSYSEYMKEKEELQKQEMEEYISLIQQKAEQIKLLTNRLLDGDGRNLEQIENGRFFMGQLAEEWEAFLEDKFKCQVNLEKCPDFSAEIDVQEFQRIFDNLVSNVDKYADEEKNVDLRIFEKENRLQIEQKNYRKEPNRQIESYKIGIESIRQIAKKYGGDVKVELTEQEFCISIILMEVRRL